MARPPAQFHEFIGQHAAVTHVRRLIAGAVALGRACPSLLLLAPPGYGKTSLAKAITAGYGTTLHRLVAGRETTPRAIVDSLAGLNANDFLFLDEVHRLRAEAQEALLLALDEQKTFRPVTGGGLDRAEFQSVAPFTLLAATDQPGRLVNALLSRLNPLEFDPYSAGELKAIAQRVAGADGVVITPQGARELARLPGCTPRRIEQLVEGLKLYFPRDARFTQAHVAAYLEGEGIDSRGCSRQQRRYLQILADAPEGRCSLTRLKVKLGLDPRSIQEHVEPLLFDLGLVEVSAEGRREITSGGRRVADECRSGREADNDDTEEREAC